MESLNTILVIFSTLSALAIAFLVFRSNGKSKRIANLENSLIQLKRSFNDLDEQAKLIVKTDLELNKAQSILDKRLNSLDALQKTSRLISTALDENEIFHRLDESLLVDLNFEKTLVLLYDEGKNFYNRIAHGFSENDIHFALTNLQKDLPITEALKEGNTFSSINTPLQIKESIIRIFDVEHFVITPILTQNGIIGAIFVGNRSNATPITEGDEELIAILANQIGQALENARLFAEVYKSTQVLESNVQERTKQLQSALDDVQSISKKKSEFISAVSHELRTPLTSIKGYASILMEGKLGEIPDAVKKRLEKINTHSDNLVGLINNLLDISRIESGRVEMSIGKCNLVQMIEDTHDLLTPQLKAKGVEFKTDLDPKIPMMYLDHSQAERIFINLIGNAIKFTPAGGTITVSAKFDGEKVICQVSDTGIGISEDDLKRLFDEFYRVENEINANVKGTGLGLPLAKKIVEAHNGEMWITSEVGKGTNFHFTLPLLEPEKIKEKNEKTEDSNH